MNEVRHLVARAVFYGGIVSVALGIPACQCDSGSGAEVSASPDEETPDTGVTPADGEDGGVTRLDGGDVPEPEEVFAAGIHPGGAFEVESEGYTGLFFVGSLQVVGDAQSEGHVAHFGPGASHAPQTTEGE